MTQFCDAVVQQWLSNRLPQGAVDGTTLEVPRSRHELTCQRVSEFQNDSIKVVAAYYYSQSNHDSPWLLIELGALRPQGTAEIRRDQIELVTPDGRVVQPATQARWSQDSARSVLLLQQAKGSRHPVSSYFSSNRKTGLRFFANPTGGGTVINERLLAPDELVLGDLFFESPTPFWDKGTYALVVRYDTAEAVLPIELR